MAKSNGALPENHPGSRKLGLILAVVIAGFFVSLAFHYYMGAVRHYPYPLNTFLFRPDDQFNDFYGNFRNGKTSFATAPADRVLNPGWGSTVIMLRAWLLYTVFYPEDPSELEDTGAMALRIPWMVSELSFVAGLFYFTHKALRLVSQDCLWAKILALTLCSYPVLVCLDRTNFENTVFILLACFAYFYAERRFVWSALVLGAVIAVKPYGVVFLALPFVDRRFKDIAVSLGTAGALTLGALLMLPNGVSQNLAIMRASMAAYNAIYVQGNEGLYFGSSLYGLAKIWMYSTRFVLAGLDARGVYYFMGRVMSAYFFFSAASFAIVVALLCGFRMEYWKKVALLVCCMNLLPFICGDYRLIHFFIPMLLFLCEEERAWGDGIFSLLFALLLIPTGYMHFVFDPVFRVNPYEASDSVVLHPLLMLGLVFAIFFSVLRKPVASDTVVWLLGFFNRPVAAKAS